MIKPKTLVNKLRSKLFALVSTKPSKKSNLENCRRKVIRIDISGNFKWNTLPVLTNLILWKAYTKVYP